jgi:hypothetical protein
MDTFYINIFAFVTVFCNNNVSCQNYVHKCYAQNIKAPEFSKYVRRKRNPIVLKHCFVKGGYLE